MIVSGDSVREGRSHVWPQADTVSDSAELHGSLSGGVAVAH